MMMQTSESETHEKRESDVGVDAALTASRSDHRQ